MSKHRGIGVSLSCGTEVSDSGERVWPVVFSVRPGSNAHLAILESGDVIVEIDGVSVRDLPGASIDLVKAIAQHLSARAVGDIVTMVFRRDGKDFITKIPIQEFDSD